MNSSFSILKTKRYHFNASRVCLDSLLSEGENSNLYGEERFPHGVSCFMDLSFEESLNLRRESLSFQKREEAREQIIEEFIQDLNEKCLNFEISYFKKKVPTTENLAQYCFKTLKRKFSLYPDLNLKEVFKVLRLEINKNHSVQVVRKNSNRLEYSLSRKYRVSSLHRHFHPDYSEEKNRRIYGKCFKLHGHEYQFYVLLFGPIDSQTGLIFSKKEMDKRVSKVIIRPFHKNSMNRLLGNTSGEIIVDSFYSLLRKAFHPAFRLEVDLKETRKNSFRCV